MKGIIYLVSNLTHLIELDPIDFLVIWSWIRCKIWSL